MTTDNDQAAVEALCKIKHEIRGRSVQGTWSKEWGIGEGGARAILDAIRNGEVPIPGMVTEAVWRAAEAECDRLRAEVERLSIERERAWQCHWDAPCGACVTCLSGDVERLKVERDRLAGLLRKIVENEPMAAAMRVFDRETYDAALAEVGK